MLPITETETFVELPLEEKSLDDLWQMRMEAIDDKRDADLRRGHVEVELQRRVHETNPTFDEQSSGSVEMAGEGVLVRMTYSRDYDVNQDAVMDLQAEKLLSAAEFDQLVSYTPKLNGTVFNQLVKRGGRLAEVLQNARRLKSARPSFEAKERAV
jgi:hypothetical protein